MKAATFCSSSMMRMRINLTVTTLRPDFESTYIREYTFSKSKTPQGDARRGAPETPQSYIPSASVDVEAFQMLTEKDPWPVRAAAATAVGRLRAKALTAHSQTA